MPKHTNIEIFRIAQTAVQPEEVERWLSFLGADTYAEDFLSSLGAEELDSDSEEVASPTVRLLTDPAGVIALAAKRCYMSFEPGLNPNVTKVRREYVDYFDNILKSGHGSVLEHATFTYAMENVSRVFTAEMNRHRAGWAISEGSLRFIRFDKDIPYWIPTSLQAAENWIGAWDSDEVNLKPEDLKNLLKDSSVENRKELSRVIFDEVFKFVERKYGQLLAIWDMDANDKSFAYKKHVTSALRRIVPLGVSTGGVWTGNVRALRHVLAMRCSPAAEEEIAYVFGRIAEDIVTSQPLLFGDFSFGPHSGPGTLPYWAPKYPKV